MKPEDEIRNKVRILFQDRNLMAVSKRTGYPRSTLQSWKQDPLKIRAVDLVRLERLLVRTVCRKQ